jgi:hypothetical protein
MPLKKVCAMAAGIPAVHCAACCWPCSSARACLCFLKAFHKCMDPTFSSFEVALSPALCYRLTRGTARRPGDVCWLTQYAWALLEAGEDLVILEAFGSSSSRGSTAAGDAAASLPGLELLRELMCSTASGADCKLVLDAPTAAVAGIRLEQVRADADFQAPHRPMFCLFLNTCLAQLC